MAQLTSSKEEQAARQHLLDYQSAKKCQLSDLISPWGNQFYEAPLCPKAKKAKKQRPRERPVQQAKTQRNTSVSSNLLRHNCQQPEKAANSEAISVRMLATEEGSVLARYRIVNVVREPIECKFLNFVRPHRNLGRINGKSQKSSCHLREVASFQKPAESLINAILQGKKRQSQKENRKARELSLCSQKSKYRSMVGYKPQEVKVLQDKIQLALLSRY